MLRIFLVLFLLFNTNVFAEDLKKVYFGGGCFWCMEESFDKAEGVIDVISGYSGGTTKNPTYKEVTYGNTGHFEVVEIVYDSEITNFENLLNIFWKNIDPFDKAGQFCDKGYSYRSVAFYQNQEQKKLIEKRIKEIELQYNKSVVTYVRDFDKFYKLKITTKIIIKLILLTTYFIKRVVVERID